MEKWVRLAATRQGRRQVGSVSVEMVSFQSVNSVAERNYFVSLFELSSSIFILQKSAKKKQARPFPTLFGHRPRLYRWYPSRPFKIQDSTQTQEMWQDTSTIKKMSVAPLRIHTYIQVSLVHCRFPSFPSLKGFTCFVQCLTEDGKADLHKDISLRLGSNAAGPRSYIASYFVIVEMLFQGNLFFCSLGISPVGNPSERTWPTSTTVNHSS